MDGKKKENAVKGGPSTFRKMLISKYPSLSLNEASKLILKVKKNHGGSLTGLQFGEILKLIKIEIKKDKQTDYHSNVELKENVEKNENETDKTFEKTCKYCYKIFLYRWTCKRHVRHVHENSDVVGFMDTKERNPQSLVKNVGKHKCTSCNKIYMYAHTLERHMIKHQEKPYVFECKFCEKKFSRKDKRKRHEQTIHRYHQIDFPAAGLGSADSLRCHMCRKEFGDDKERFFAHLSAKQCQTKTINFNLDEEHRFECCFCAKKYLDKDALIKHMKMKHNKTKVMFNCKVCTSEFQYKSTMVRHMKSIHGVDNN